MITGLNLDEIFRYSLEEDNEPKTVWKLGVIPSDLFALLTQEDGDSILKAYKYLQVSLKGWDNFDIEYKTVEDDMFGRKMFVVPMDVLGKIPLTVVSRIAEKIVEINQISDKERKN